MRLLKIAVQFRQAKANKRAKADMLKLIEIQGLVYGYLVHMWTYLSGCERFKPNKKVQKTAFWPI